MTLHTQQQAQIAWGVKVWVHDRQNRAWPYAFSLGALPGFDERVQQVSIRRPPLALVGGISALGGTASVVLHNEDGLFDSFGAESIERLEIRLYWHDGTDFSSYQVRFRGSVVGANANAQQFTLQARDQFYGLARTWPLDVIRLEDYPLAPLQNVGLPLPLHFGDLTRGPDQGTMRLAPTVQVAGETIYGQHHLGQANGRVGSVWCEVGDRYFAEITGENRVVFADADAETVTTTTSTTTLPATFDFTMTYVGQFSQNRGFRPLVDALIAAAPDGMFEYVADVPLAGDYARGGARATRRLSNLTFTSTLTGAAGVLPYLYYVDISANRDLEIIGPFMFRNGTATVAQIDKGDIVYLGIGISTANTLTGTATLRVEGSQVQEARTTYQVAIAGNQRGESLIDIRAPQRRILSTLGSPRDDNAESNWAVLADYDPTTGLNDNNLLRVALEALPELGTITQQNIQILIQPPAQNTLSATLFKGETDAAVIAFTQTTPLGLSGLRQYVAEIPQAERTWQLADLYLSIEAATDSRIVAVVVETLFESNVEESRLFAAVHGGQSNGVRQMYEILTSSIALGIPTSFFHADSYKQAAARRSGWDRSFSVVRQQDGKNQSLLDELVRECACWLHYDASGQIRCTPQALDQPPVRAFTSDHIFGDIQVQHTPNSQLCNYINLLYDRDVFGEYHGSLTVGAVVRQKGRGGRLSVANGVYTLTSATDLNLQPREAAYLYLDNDALCQVVPGTLATNKRSVVVRPFDGAPLAAGTYDWWLGRTLDLRAMRSYRQLGETLQTIGGRRVELSDRADAGALQSDTIADRPAAERLVSHLADWHFGRGLSVQFTTGMRASDLYQGQVIVVSHPSLPAYAPVATLMPPALSGEQAAVLRSLEGRPIRVRPQPDGQGDWCLLTSTEAVEGDQYPRQEVVRITRSWGDRVWAERGALGTERVAHGPGALLRHIDRLFFITALDTLDPHTFRLIATQLPRRG